ncbi:hypothetical protein ACVBEG_27760 [Pseudomonas sp. GG8]
MSSIPKRTLFGLTLEDEAQGRATFCTRTLHRLQLGEQDDPSLGRACSWPLLALLTHAKGFLHMPIGRPWEALREDEIA